MGHDIPPDFTVIKRCTWYTLLGHRPRVVKPYLSEHPLIGRLLIARHQTNFRGAREASIERLADSVQQHLDTEKLWDLLDAKGPLA